MKYIRTKDRIFEVYKEKEDGYIIRTKPFLETTNKEYYLNLFFSKERVIKAADTIEDLVDLYVLDDRKDKHHYIENEISLLPCIYIYDKKNTSVYGEIWVDGELHKVAKVNEKGELELL